MDMSSIYRRIAKEYGVSAKEVERDMQAAIDRIYEDEDQNGHSKASGSIPCQGERPTPEEFIQYAVLRINTNRE